MFFQSYDEFEFFGFYKKTGISSFPVSVVWYCKLRKDELIRLRKFPKMGGILSQNAWDFVVVGFCRGGILSRWEIVRWENVEWENVGASYFTPPPGGKLEKNVPYVMVFNRYFLSSRIFLSV